MDEWDEMASSVSLMPLNQIAAALRQAAAKGREQMRKRAATRLGMMMQNHYVGEFSEGWDDAAEYAVELIRALPLTEDRP